MGFYTLTKKERFEIMAKVNFKNRMDSNCIFKYAKEIINGWTLCEKITLQPIMLDLLSMVLIASDPYLTAEQQSQLMIEDVK